MVSQIKSDKDTALQFLGIPSSNIPKFKIGDYINHEFQLDNYMVIQQGRITAILAYEREPGNPNTITANYTYVVTASSHHAFMIGEEDSADETELSLS